MSHDLITWCQWCDFLEAEGTWIGPVDWLRKGKYNKPGLWVLLFPGSGFSSNISLNYSWWNFQRCLKTNSSEMDDFSEALSLDFSIFSFTLGLPASEFGPLNFSKGNWLESNPGVGGWKRMTSFLRMGSRGRVLIGSDSRKNFEVNLIAKKDFKDWTAVESKF